MSGIVPVCLQNKLHCRQSGLRTSEKIILRINLRLKMAAKVAVFLIFTVDYKIFMW